MCVCVCGPPGGWILRHVQQGGGILSTLITNRHSMARIGVLDVDWPALFRLDLKEPGYKVAWIEKLSECLLLFLQPDFAPRAPSSSPGHVLAAISNQQAAGVLEPAKLERKQPQSRQSRFFCSNAIPLHTTYTHTGPGWAASNIGHRSPHLRFARASSARCPFCSPLLRPYYSSAGGRAARGSHTAGPQLLHNIRTGHTTSHTYRVLAVE